MGGPSRLFVYGSLRRGAANHYVLRGASYVRTARTEHGLALYDLGPYPAMVRGGDGAVEGEIYEVDEVLLADLDVFEGPDEYRRQTIALDDGTIVEAYLFVCALPPGAKPIESGSWR